MRLFVFHCVFSTLLLISSGCRDATPSARQGFPQRPVKIIVPFAAGGGSDMFARIITEAVEKHALLPERMVIINQPGAGGTIGSRRLLNSEPDGHTILCLHEGILTAKYSGQVTYGPEAFAPIAGTGTAPLVICVADASPYESLSDLMTSATETPDAIVYSASIGAPSQFAGLMLEQVTPGARFRYVQTGGGARRFVAIDGGHVDVSAFSLAEYSQFRSGGLRALAICSTERHADFPDVPTALEQGFDCVSVNMHFWWAPRNTPPERIQVLTAALERAMQLPDVRERLRSMRMDPAFITGGQLTAELNQREDRLRLISKPPAINLPNVPLIIAFATFALGALVVAQRFREHQRDRSLGLPVAGSPGTTASRMTSSAVPLFAASCGIAVYVAAMQFGVLSFRYASVGFLIGFGVAVLWNETRSGSKQSAVSFFRTAAGYAVFAVLLSVAIEAVFTQILMIDLP